MAVIRKLFNRRTIPVFHFAGPFISRKVSTISTVSLGDTSFNLEDATNIPTSKSVPDFKSHGDKSSNSPRDIRKLRSRFSKENSIDDETFESGDYTSSLRSDLDDIHEVPKPLETDLDDLSMTGSENTMTSENSSSSQIPSILLTRSSDTPVPPEVLVRKWNDQSGGSSRETTPKLEKKIVKMDEKDGSRKTYNVAEKQSKNASPIAKDKYTKIDSTRNEFYLGEAPKATLDEDIESTTSETSSTDENKNRLLQLNVNEKGNVTKIMLHGDMASESSTDPVKKSPILKARSDTTLVNRSPKLTERATNHKGIIVLRRGCALISVD